MIKLSEYQLKIIILISLELLDLCPTLLEADAKPIGHLCRSSNDCFIYSFCIRNNSLDRYGKCQCIPGYIQIDSQCIAPKRYGYDCEFNLDCQHYDPNSICEFPILGLTNKCICNNYHKYKEESGLCQPNHLIDHRSRQVHIDNDLLDYTRLSIYFYYNMIIL